VVKFVNSCVLRTVVACDRITAVELILTLSLCVIVVDDVEDVVVVVLI
jgi:hypothetical protein